MNVNERISHIIAEIRENRSKTANNYLKNVKKYIKDVTSERILQKIIQNSRKNCQ